MLKSTSKFLKRQGGMNKQKPTGNIVQNGGHSKLEDPLYQRYRLCRFCSI